MSDNTPTPNSWRDHSQPCEHDIPDIDGFTWQDDAGNWFCDEEWCPGGREIVLRYETVTIDGKNVKDVWLVEVKHD